VAEVDKERGCDDELAAVVVEVLLTRKTVNKEAEMSTSFRHLQVTHDCNHEHPLVGQLTRWLKPSGGRIAYVEHAVEQAYFR